MKKTKENSEEIFFGFDMKIRDEKFQVNLFNKRGSFPFPIIRMFEKSNNAISSSSFRITGASSDPES